MLWTTVIIVFSSSKRLPALCYIFALYFDWMAAAARLKLTPIIMPYYYQRVAGLPSNLIILMFFSVSSKILQFLCTLFYDNYTLKMTILEILLYYL